MGDPSAAGPSAGTVCPQPTAAARRRAALRTLLLEDGLEALLVTDPVDVRYLCGFTGSDAALLVHVDGDDDTVLATDARYTTQAGAEAGDLPLRISRHCGPALLAALDEPVPVGFDSARVTVDARDELAAAAPEVTLRRAPGRVERLRSVKDDEEVDALRRACATADAALADLIAAGELRAGRTEREVARDLETRMLAHGAEAPSFETIVAAGPHSALPHHRPTDTPLARGDLLVVDFGAVVAGYHSDMTRTLVLGAAATWQQELHDLVAAAAAAGRRALGPGVATRDVDAAARTVVEDGGHGEQFVHGVGHGVGLAVHEAPALSASADATLESGMTVTVEPGVYLAGRGGVRVEDTLVVRPGGADALTTTTRELVVVDD